MGKCSRESSIEHPSPRCAWDKDARGEVLAMPPQSSGEVLARILNRVPFAPALAGEKVPKADEGVLAPPGTRYRAGSNRIEAR